MPIYESTVKFTPEALAAIRAQGFADRESKTRAFVESSGARMVGYYWPTSPDWDCVTITEHDETDDGFALLSFVKASGTVERAQITRLRTSAEADAAIAEQVGWTPPRS